MILPNSCLPTARSHSISSNCSVVDTARMLAGAGATGSLLFQVSQALVLPLLAPGTPLPYRAPLLTMDPAWTQLYVDEEGLG
jgi:hypothetical protein